MTRDLKTRKEALGVARDAVEVQRRKEGTLGEREEGLRERRGKVSPYPIAQSCELYGKDQRADELMMMSRSMPRSRRSSKNSSASIRRLGTCRLVKLRLRRLDCSFFLSPCRPFGAFNH